MAAAQSVAANRAGPTSVPRPKAGTGGGTPWMVILLLLGLLVGAGVVIIPSILAGRPETQAQPSTPHPSADLPQAQARIVLVSMEAGR